MIEQSLAERAIASLDILRGPAVDVELLGTQHHLAVKLLAYVHNLLLVVLEVDQHLLHRPIVRLHFHVLQQLAATMQACLEGNH